jgi:hypothetical protein
VLGAYAAPWEDARLTPIRSKSTVESWWRNPMLRTAREWYVLIVALVIAVCAILLAFIFNLIAWRPSRRVRWPGPLHNLQSR